MCVLSLQLIRSGILILLASKTFFFLLCTLYLIYFLKKYIMKPRDFQVVLKYEHKFYQGILLAVLEGQIIQ